MSSLFNPDKIKTYVKKYLRKKFQKVKTKYACFQVVRHGFWFIDIPRTSSSSIRAELGSYFGFPYGKVGLLEKEYASKQEIFSSHKRAKEMCSILGESIWKKIFSFTIVRNPWERIYSLYEFRKKRRGIPEKMSFRQYIISLNQAFANNEFSGTLFEYPPMRYGASDFLLDDNNQIIVDYIVRYENREHDLAIIASKINCPQLGRLHLQSAVKSKEHYSYFYDLETKEIIEKIYAKDIELFNYHFEDRI